MERFTVRHLEIDCPFNPRLNAIKEPSRSWVLLGWEARASEGTEGNVIMRILFQKKKSSRQYSLFFPFPG